MINSDTDENAQSRDYDNVGEESDSKFSKIIYIVGRYLLIRRILAFVLLARKYFIRFWSSE